MYVCSMYACWWFVILKKIGTNQGVATSKLGPYTHTYNACWCQVWHFSRLGGQVCQVHVSNLGGGVAGSEDFACANPPYHPP